MGFLEGGLVCIRHDTNTELKNFEATWQQMLLSSKAGFSACCHNSFDIGFRL